MAEARSSLHRLGGRRPDPEAVKREGWRAERILVVDAADPRLTWPERMLVEQLGDRLYGRRSDAMARIRPSNETP
ncbi:MAG: hypothetical protein QF926_06800 [Alphaproteobacteria bacterium]|nr:hypothetical protein [Alphaproteobacteria bacterium]